VCGEKEVEAVEREGTLSGDNGGRLAAGKAVLLADREMPAQSLPFVTIIMPVRNEAAFIEQSLTSVLRQDYPPNKMEVLVVDGMSNDSTREIVQGLAATAQEEGLPSSIVLDNPGRIAPTALNIGVRHARGDILVRVDGHCELEPDYVHRCAEVLAETGADNVGGIQRAVAKGWRQRTIALATTSPFGVGNARFRYSQQPGWVDTVYLGAYGRDVFEKIGGFDEELVRNQDDELNFRLTQNGGKIWLDPRIRCVYHCRSGLRDLWRQYFQYGLYKVRVIQKRGTVPAWRHVVPAAFISALGASLLLAMATASPFWALSVSGPYAIANLCGSLWAARRDLTALPLLPLVFGVMHSSYGLGFIAGLWRWRAFFGSRRASQPEGPAPRI